MGHHYLPQFYLHGFAERRRIWVHDHFNGRTFPSQPKAVANEKGMYTEDLEQHLANEVEGPAQSALEAVRALRAVGLTERIALAKYIVCLWKRTPEGRTRALSHIPHVADSLRKEYDAAVASIGETSLELRALAEMNRGRIDDVLNCYVEAPPPGLWQSNLEVDTSPEAVDSLLSMTWRFLHTQSFEYLTCDNPVFFFPHEGIGSEYSELTLPLSSTVALWANRQPLRGPVFINALGGAVREINRRTAANATRFVFSRSNEPWILPFVCKRSYVLNRLV